MKPIGGRILPVQKTSFFSTTGTRRWKAEFRVSDRTFEVCSQERGASRIRTVAG